MKKALIVCSTHERLKEIENLKEEKLVSVKSKILEIQNDLNGLCTSLASEVQEILKKLNLLPDDFTDEDYTLTLENDVFYLEKNSDEDSEESKEKNVKNDRDRRIRHMIEMFYDVVLETKRTNRGNS